MVFHQLAQELGALEHRDAGGQRCLDFDIVIRDGGRAHDQVGAAHIFGAGDRAKTRTPAAASSWASGESAAVRTAHRVAAFQQQAGDRGKSAAADADEVNALFCAA